MGDKHIISMLLVPLLLLLSGVESTPTFAHRDSLTGEALTCDKCPPGTHMATYCSGTTPTVCARCRDHHFTELWNYLPKCLYCNNLCIEKQEVETECTATSNRVCRCKDGFYISGDSCMRHLACGPRHGVQTKGTSQTNTVCETCSNGHFSTSSSALESCVKHQECAGGQIALLPGSLNQDTMCGSCEDLSNGSETLRTFFSGFLSMHRIRVIKLKRFVARHIHKLEDGTLPKQRGPLMDQIRAWLTRAPEEQLKTLPKMLKASQLSSLTDKLETMFNEIKQQSSNCTLPLLDV
ncbi:tumor necrosis factor receptor superfamily member 6B-like [Pseudoliparis swirei]|uniref:tumor necrosis factor receptor superfamily member 6B-like n=1 Tax=Pseudoliparis swirei TaxID=2059687 RepID=UPI0024BE3420|nr:tumor necrosis factor receptor superfamily member 6B-like [Pseudoliparis swirei]